MSHRSIPVLLLAAALLLAACIGQEELQPTASPSVAPASVAPSASAEPSAAASDTPAPTPEVTPEPSAATASPSEPTSSGASGPAELCSGNADNRSFLDAVAKVVEWDVYCAILPSGWNVSAGQYRLASGGWMEIAYKGPGGARLQLQEGAFCHEADGCVPSGTDSGSAAFGDRTGTLVTGDDGSYAVVVDRGAARSWLAVGTGLDVETFKAYAAALMKIEG